MLKQFFFAALVVFSATVAMSFSMGKISPMTVKSLEGGNSLEVTNPVPGTASLSWSFNQPSLVYIYIIEDVVHRQVIRSGQTNQTSCSVNGLASGTYRISVSNGSNYIVIDEFIIL